MKTYIIKTAVFFIFLFNSFFSFCFEKKTIVESPDKKLYKKILENSSEPNLYSSKENVLQYVEFLIKNHFLVKNDSHKEYNILIYDHNQDWLIILEEKKINEFNDIIIDYLDSKYDFVFIINKSTGGILFFEENNGIPSSHQ